MPKVALPRFKNLDAVVDYAQRLHATSAQPTGNWSLAQILKHLAGALELCRRGIPDAPSTMPFYQRLLRRPALWYVLYYQFPPGRPSPKLLVFGPHLDTAETLTELETQTKLYNAYNGPFAPHPMFGPLNKKLWTDFHLSHAHHHLAYVPIPK